MPRPITKLKRKVLHRGMSNTTPKVSLPKWWIGDCEEVKIEVYSDKLVIKRVEVEE